MQFVKRMLSKEGPVSMIVAVLVGVLFVTFSVQAATTISTAIVTGGTVTATGDVNTAGALNVGATIAASTSVSVTGTTPTALQVAGTASTSKLRVGGDDTNTTVAGATTTINGIVSGFCTFPSVTIVATSTDTGICVGATGVRAGDRVFVTATSSLPASMFITAASSTAAGTIQLRINYPGNLTNATLATGVNSVWFWVVR